MSLPNYDDWKLATPPRLDDPPADWTECRCCGDIAEVEEDSGLCWRCWRQSEIAVARHEEEYNPPPDDDEPADEDATPVMDDPEDPGEHLEPHKPDLGGEG